MFKILRSCLSYDADVPHDLFAIAKFLGTNCDNYRITATTTTTTTGVSHNKTRPASHFKVLPSGEFNSMILERHSPQCGLQNAFLATSMDLNRFLPLFSYF